MKTLGVSIALIALLCAPSANADDNIDRPGKGDWCYLPMHSPTPAEQKAFVDDVAPAAVTASKKHGVPAAIIAGMAIVESGYGLTRIAIKSNNIYAFKWPGSKIGKGYEKFVLWCQPDWDEGNVYPAFKSRADAVDFVAWRLAASDHYKAASRKYKEAVGRGADKRKTALVWLEEIAQKYNYDPTAYVKKVSAVVRRPVKNSTVSMWELAE